MTLISNLGQPKTQFSSLLRVRFRWTIPNSISLPKLFNYCQTIREDSTFTMIYSDWYIEQNINEPITINLQWIIIIFLSSFLVQVHDHPHHPPNHQTLRLRRLRLHLPHLRHRHRRITDYCSIKTFYLIVFFIIIVTILNFIPIFVFVI